MFPIQRPRRLRSQETLRRMVRETELSASRLVLPLFVCPGKGVREPIQAMPGCARLSVDELVAESQEALSLGVPAVILFGIPPHKDPEGSGAWAEDGIVQQAARALKKEVPQLFVITDVCLCEYTDHGHCGRIENGEVLNDPTLELLARTAVSQALAGSDMVAPSDMMDGRVAAIRAALDVQKLSRIPILSYAIKHASAFYGPFREAAGSAPSFGDRKAYQMDPANAREAMKEATLDLEEGADLLMVKPAMPCLDLLRRARERFDVPLAAYQVSGEYAMICAAAERGWLDRKLVMMESLTAIRRAGADLILTYFAKDAARVLKAG
ncbi:MAG TPA: porphobilinogen synthase [Candidatus Polarisedimenticolia bacterium]|nr:porphobilinogen synthase [Candidatus Polarisedimenticolia bacterium]